MEVETLVAMMVATGDAAGSLFVMSLCQNTDSNLPACKQSTCWEAEDGRSMGCCSLVANITGITAYASRGDYYQ